MFYCVYQTTNLINGKIYVGVHATLKLDDSYLGSGKLLLQAIKKYGRKNFKKEIQFIFESEEQMYQKEAEIVTREFIQRPNTYNITEGGKLETTKEAKRKGGLTTAIKKVGIHSVSSRIDSIQRIPLLHEKCKKEKLGVYNPKFQKAMWLRSMQSEARIKRVETFKRTQHSQGTKNSQFGTCWVTNGVINQKIKKEEKIPEGFWRGRKVQN